MTMKYEKWVEKYKPLTEVWQDGSVNIKAFDTYGEDVKFLNQQNPLCIWTEVDWRGSGRGKNRIVNGAKLVNRIYYYVTEIPFEEGTYIEVYSEY